MLHQHTLSSENANEDMSSFMYSTHELILKYTNKISPPLSGVVASTLCESGLLSADLFSIPTPSLLDHSPERKQACRQEQAI